VGCAITSLLIAASLVWVLQSCKIFQLVTDGLVCVQLNTVNQRLIRASEVSNLFVRQSCGVLTQNVGEMILNSCDVFNFDVIFLDI